MDKEIIYINSILNSSREGFTTSEISKKIFDQYGVKISRTIVKNYLWSYFRDVIEYNSSNYSYILKMDQFLINDINVLYSENTPRPIGGKIEGAKIIIEIDKDIPLEKYIKAIGIINYRIGKNKNNLDFIKQINRTLEQLNE